MKMLKNNYVLLQWRKHVAIDSSWENYETKYLDKPDLKNNLTIQEGIS